MPPQTMGTMVTRVSCPSVFQKGNCPAAPLPRSQSMEEATIQGMVKTHTRLEVAVRVTESAVSPLASFLAMPAGNSVNFPADLLVG